MRKTIILAVLLASTGAFANPYDQEVLDLPQGRWTHGANVCLSDHSADLFRSLIIEENNIQQGPVFCEALKVRVTSNKFHIKYRVKALCSDEYMRKRNRKPVPTTVDIKVSDEGLTIEADGDKEHYIIKCDDIAQVR